MNPDNLRQAIEHQGLLAVGVGFLTGFLFSFNPVAIASVPVALAYLTKSREKAEAFRFGWMFVLGMIVTHVALGFLAGLLGRSIEQVIGRGWGLILGPLLIVLGVVWLIRIPIKLPALPLRVRRPNKSLGAFLLGIPFSVAVCPVCTPALVIILGAVAAVGSPIVGALVLLAFATGRAIPILIGAFAIGWLEHAAALDRFRRPFEMVGGAVLILAGVYMLNAVYFWIPDLAG